MGHTLDTEIRELLEQAFVADASGCCGAGRHMIVYGDDADFHYVHDSAQQRAGTDESHVVWAKCCNAETAYHDATEGYVEAGFRAEQMVDEYEQVYKDMSELHQAVEPTDIPVEVAN